MIRNPQSAIRNLLIAAVLTASTASAQADPSGRWRTLHTPHFRVHFQPDYRAVAQEAAREAERAYALLAGELRPPRGVVDLTLADNTDAGNGLATTYPSNRMTVWLTPPTTDPGLQNYDSWLRLVIVHELAHVFHLDRARGIWKTLQTVFGRAPGLFPNEYQPTWVVEGIATYYESRFTTGGRIADGFHDQLIGGEGAASRSPWDALAFTRWPDGHTPYAYGARFLSVMSGRVGDSLVPRLIEGAAGQLIPYRIGRPLRLAAGGQDVLAEWTAATRLEMARGDAPALVAALRSAPVARVSPDGRYVAYLHDDGKTARRLRVVTADGWRVEWSRVVTGGVSYDWWGGDTLVVAQLDFTGRRRVRSDLYYWIPSSGDWRRATRGARLTEPRAGGTATLLTPGDNAPVIGGARVPELSGTTWGDVVRSPDGHVVAATRHRDGRWALVQWPVAQPESVAVLFDPNGLVADPVWSRDGVLYFVAYVDGLPQVFRWSEDAAVPVTADPRGARHPAPLPDGSLLYTALGAAGWELRRIPQIEPARAPFRSPADHVPFDSAPPVAARETGYAAWPSLRPHFWIPVGINAGVAGTFFGAATVGVDAVGRTAYLAQGLVAGNPLRGSGTLVVVSEALGNPTLDVGVSNGWSPVGTASTGHRISEESRDAELGATFVQRRWRRTASLRLAAEYEGTRFVSNPDTTMASVCTGCRRRDFVGGSVSLGLAHFVSAPLSISAQDGFSWSVTYRRREEQASARWSDELRSRLALYLRLPVGRGSTGGLAAPVFALRFAAGATQGPAQRTLSVGGVSSGTLDLGLGLTIGSSRVFPVRGYASGTLRGSRAATAAAELRLPVALVGRGIGHLPLGMDKFSVALFADAGDAWNAGVQPRLTRLVSGGMELVGDMTLNYGFPIRARLGAAQPRSGALQAYLVFGSDF